MATYKKLLKNRNGDIIIPVTDLMSDYSTSEVKTGCKWIDGKPIYKKTIQYQNLPIGETNIQHGISNMGVVIKYESFCKIDNTTTLQIPTFAPTSSNAVTIWTTYSSYFKVFATISMDLLYVTLYYTKTTD